MFGNPQGAGMASTIWRRQRALFFDNSLTIFFASLVVIVAIIEPAFLEWSNIQSILRGAAVIGIIAAGMTVVMVAGGFDLSVARVAALCGIVVAQLNGYGPVVTIGAMLAVCIAIGLVNGTLIAKAKVNPFVVTLGMLSIASTLTLVVSSGRVIRDLDPWLRALAQGDIGPIPKAVVIFLLVAGFCHLLLSRTQFGRYVYAVGGNPEASRLAGIKVDRVQIWCYVLVAVCSGVAGTVLTSRLNSASPVALPGGELDAIAAVIIGGTRLGGGHGNIIPGTLIGVLILASMNNGLILLGIDPDWQGLMKGSVIILAVGFDILQGRRSGRIRS
jgi:ribose/xylose/arabinose/galactoside ABC-type transport system permease subunit